jgi:Ca2+-binding RTX toxin-like protein
MFMKWLQKRVHGRSNPEGRRGAQLRSKEWRLRLEPLESRDVPSTFTVLNTNDAGAGSLRDAVAQADLAGGTNTINFDLGSGPQMITLTSGQLELTGGTTTIDGTGAAVTVSGNLAGRIVQIDSGATGELLGLTLSGGKVPDRGGAVLNLGALVAADCAFSGNQNTAQTATGGGALDNVGTAALTSCTFQNNGEYLNGGAIDDEAGAALTVCGCSFQNNTCAHFAGAIWGAGSTSSITVTDSSFSGNFAVGDAGAIFFEGHLALTNDSFTNNRSTNGGAILFHSGSAPTIDHCTFTGNKAVVGGAFLNDQSIVVATNCTFTGNTAFGVSYAGGGAIVNTDGPNPTGGPDVYLANDTFTGNSASLGGAIDTSSAAAASSMVITGCTFTGNASSQGGGAINTRHFQGVTTISISASTFANNTATTAGGAINNSDPRADVRVAATTIADNSAGASGGGIANAGTLNLSAGTTLTGNQAASGGGVANTGTESDNQATFSQNTAKQGAGGGLDNQGLATETAADFDGNKTTGAAGNGGGIANDGNLTVIATRVANCVAAALGGGVFNSGQTTIEHSNLSNDQAVDGGGVATSSTGQTIIDESSFASDAAAGVGGGAESTGDTAIGNSTFAGGEAGDNGGGVGANSGQIYVYNTTITGNGAANSGGGIDIGGAAATLVNCTVVGNTAALGGGIHVGTGTVELGNTLVAENTGAGAADVLPDGGEGVVSLGHNLIGDGTGSTLVNGAGGDRVGTTTQPIDPLLAPLANNGGPTQTLALLPGSPAIDAGEDALALDPNANPLTTDQRGPGFPRVLGGAVDIGAFEAPDQPPVVSGVAVSAVEGAPFGGQTVATFTDPDGPELLPGIAARYSATLDWGDGSAPTAGTITFASGAFTVSGDHTYAGEGRYTITTTVHHDTAPDVTATSTAAVSDPAVTATGGFSLTAVRNAPFAGQTVAVFTDPGGAEPNGADPNPDLAAHYSADVDWGDGTGTQLDSGAITFHGAPGSTTDAFTVTGDHTYRASGCYPITVTIHHEGAAPQVVTSRAVVSAVGNHLQGCCDANSLVIGASGAGDTVRVVPQGPQTGTPTDVVKVLIDGVDQGDFTGFNRIAIYGGAGNDDLEIAEAVKTDACIYGGAGDDRLKGGGGNNILIGGPGADLLIGGRGRDILIGGGGRDRLVAGAGEDILIGGSTIYDDPSGAANADALCAIMQEWARTDATYCQRVDHLTGAPGGLNGPFYLEGAGPGQTVFDDQAADTLTGGSGSDLFFARLCGTDGDTLTDLHTGERVIRI